MLEDFLTLVDGEDRHIFRLVGWVLLLLICVTNSKYSHKVHLSRILRYYVELQVLDISIASERLEMTTWCARLILTFSNYERVCMHFVPLRLERITIIISPVNFTSVLVTRTFM